MAKYKVGDKVLFTDFAGAPKPAEVVDIHYSYIVKLESGVRRYAAKGYLAPYVEPFKVGDLVRVAPSVRIREIIKIHNGIATLWSLEDGIQCVFQEQLEYLTRA